MANFNVPLPLDLNDILRSNSKVILNSYQPEAPQGNTNVDWQTDEFGNVSANVPNGGGGGTPGGSTSELQYNSNSVFAGASGGTTNGTHFAFGDGSAVNMGPTSEPGGNTFSGLSILNLNETVTNPSGEVALSIDLTFNPSDTPTNLCAATFFQAIGEGNNWNGSQGLTGGGYQAIYTGTGTGGSAMTGLAGGIFEALNTNSGELEEAIGSVSVIANFGSGTIDTASAIYAHIDNVGTNSIMTVSDIYKATVGTNNGTFGTVYYFHAYSPVDAGTYTNPVIGLQIDDLSNAGDNDSNPIVSNDPNVSLFAGPISLPYTQAQVVYSAGGTALPSGSDAGIGARAFVSDALTTTFGAAYVSGHSGKVPVYSDGSSWYVG